MLTIDVMGVVHKHRKGNLIAQTFNNVMNACTGTLWSKRRTYHNKSLLDKKLLTFVFSPEFLQM